MNSLFILYLFLSFYLLFPFIFILFSLSLSLSLSLHFISPFIPIPNLSQIPLYSMKMVLNTIIQCNLGTFDMRHNTFNTLECLLWWEPFMYLGSKLLKQLVLPGNSDESIPDTFFLHCSNTKVSITKISKHCLIIYIMFIQNTLSCSGEESVFFQQLCDIWYFLH